jgi:hypothetical protein
VPVELSFGTIPTSELSRGADGAKYWLLEGGLGLCPMVPAWKSVELGGCVGLRLGDIHTVGRGFSTNSDIDRPLADAILGGRALFLVARPVFLSIAASAVVPFVRQRTTATASDGSTLTLDERPALGAEFSLGVGVRFSP